MDEDPRIIALLEGVLQESPAFVSRVMSAAGLSAQTAPTPQPLIEPLSDRELEVLAEIAAGLSNREIAGRLVISVGTVKRYINNIYGKLEVGSRTEAIAKAHALHLLG